jgi:hypothetical protein
VAIVIIILFESTLKINEETGIQSELKSPTPLRQKKKKILCKRDQESEYGKKKKKKNVNVSLTSQGEGECAVRDYAIRLISL